jgi:hypothetical protein
MRDKKTYAILELNPLNTNDLFKVFNLKKEICGNLRNLRINNSQQST